MTTIPASVPARETATRFEGMFARPALWLGLLLSSSIVVRLSTAWQHTSPRTFPDEYLYPAVARSLGAGAGLTVRGMPAHFPAILEPLLTAPIWLVHDTETAYRLTQALHVAAMSAAALPVFWLAGRVGAPKWQAFCCAMFTVAVPSLIFSSYMSADAIAYPLALGAIAVGVAVLDRPSRTNQIGFVLFAGLATLARVQYIIIPAAFVAAMILLERGHVFAAARRYVIVLGLVVTPALAVVVVGPSRLLGYYHGILEFDISPGALVHWGAVDALLLAYAGGIAIVPIAIAGLALGLRRTALRAQRAFTALTLSFVALLLVEAVLYAANGSERFQERYLITIGPLLAVAFCSGAKRLPQGRRLAVIVAGVLFVLSVLVPLGGYTILDGKQDSPFLMAVFQLEQTLTFGDGSLVVAIAAGVLAAIGCAAALRPRIFVPVALGATLVAVTAGTVGATAYDRATSARMEATYSANGSWTWIDDFRLGQGSVLVTPGADPAAAESHLFWNRTLTSVLRLPGASAVDVYGDTPTRIGRNGLLRSGGAPVHGPILVEESNGLVRLDNARMVRSTPGATLWLPHAEARMAMLTVGRSVDSWVGPNATVTVWPKADMARRGVVALKLRLPAGVPNAIVQVTAAGFERVVTLAAERSTVVRVPFNAVSGPITVRLTGKTVFLQDGRAIVVQLAPPVLIPPGR